MFLAAGDDEEGRAGPSGRPEDSWRAMAGGQSDTELLGAPRFAARRCLLPVPRAATTCLDALCPALSQGASSVRRGRCFSAIASPWCDQGLR